MEFQVGVESLRGFVVPNIELKTDFNVTPTTWLGLLLNFNVNAYTKFEKFFKLLKLKRESWRIIEKRRHH